MDKDVYVYVHVTYLNMVNKEIQFYIVCDRKSRERAPTNLGRSRKGWKIILEMMTEF